MVDRIKWGIIGCGNVTELKSGPAFNKVDHSELVAVMRRNAALAEDMPNDITFLIFMPMQMI